jgi:hypothetical protein
VLSRLLREVRKTGERASARPNVEPDANALDAELDALLGGPDVPSVASIAAHTAHDPDANASFETGEFDTGGSGVFDALDPASARSGAFDALDDHEVIEQITSRRADRQRESAKQAVPVEKYAPPPSAATSTAHVASEAAASAEAQVQPDAARSPEDADRRGLRLDDLVEDDSQTGRSGPGAWLGGFFVFAAVILVVAYFVLGQSQMRRLVGLGPLEYESAAVAPKADKPARA